MKLFITGTPTSILFSLFYVAVFTIVQCVGTEVYQFILISIRSGSTKIRLSQYRPSAIHLSCGAPDFPARRDFPNIFSKYQDECLARKVMFCFEIFAFCFTTSLRMGRKTFYCCYSRYFVTSTVFVTGYLWSDQVNKRSTGKLVRNSGFFAKIMLSYQ